MILKGRKKEKKNNYKSRAKHYLWSIEKKVTTSRAINFHKIHKTAICTHSYFPSYGMPITTNVFLLLCE